MASVVIPYAPRSQFKPYHERTQRFAAIVAHRRAGKTVATINDIIKRACLCKLEEPRYAYIAPFFVQAKDIAWLYLKRFAMPLIDYGGQVNESELRVTLPNKASIRLYGADNADRLRGIYLDGLVLDEYADMAPSIWGSILRATLADRRGWATFIGTPKGHNAFYEVWNRALLDKDWFTLRLRASETELLDADELLAAKRELTDDQYEQEFETSFEAALLGAILGRQIAEAEKQGRISDDTAYDADGAGIEISSDIGRRDASSWWFWQPRVGGYALVDYDEDNGLDGYEWCKRLEERITSHGRKLARIHLPHDARAKTFMAKHSAVEAFILHFGADKIRVVADSSKADRYNAARRVIQRCEFAKTATHQGLEGLRAWQFEYDEERKEFGKEARHDWASHPGDAFSYGCQVMEEDHKVADTKPPERRLIVGANEITLNDMWQMLTPASRRI